MLGFKPETLTNVVPEPEEPESDDALAIKEFTDELAINHKENNELNLKTLYYSKTSTNSFDLTFNDPGEKNDEKNFNINYSISAGMIIRWNIGRVTLSADTENKVTTSKYAYWFEPTKYQFSVQEVSDQGTEDMFRGIDSNPEEINVTIKRS